MWTQQEEFGPSLKPVRTYGMESKGGAYMLLLLHLWGDVGGVGDVVAATASGARVVGGGGVGGCARDGGVWCSSRQERLPMFQLSRLQKNSEWEVPRVSVSFRRRGARRVWKWVGK